ncbi:3-methyladenine DNA glycosylase [Rhodococcus spelaei]|uniref:3-methyladenine DNA glycosylase n=1 Tax=Rhodococcus spelaei TaxID=2546320 RepID=A0A541B7E4_9NOCA|nr:3-methyladenine DNA glycosylase [Rhodococcus spelaei]TQF68234.1 3-methyladenine DNA glycosylase [Rhodococcus spelaei]
MTDSAVSGGPLVLSQAEWTARRDAHRERVDALIGPHVSRQTRGEKHPVIDFLFTYYSLRPTQLRRWHPGFGVRLTGPAAREYWEYSGYRRCEDGAAEPDPRLLGQRRSMAEFTARLLAGTAARPAQLGCFGLHEWAMVYRGGEQAVRHSGTPLRLGPDGTDAVVESMNLRCSHYDAFRFFTADAVGRNEIPLRREDQAAREQPGCLHAGMDLYKWCYKLVPLIDSDLLLRCFELAIDARELDMRASPYDLAELGYSPVPIETAAGRADYVRTQSALAERAAPLRAELLERCRVLLDAAADGE